MSQNVAKLNWVEDFSTVRDPSIENLILGVGQAQRFLNQSNQYFIAGAKGLGKTLLLINKRLHIQQQHSEESRQSRSSIDVHLIPSDEPFLDVMAGERNVSKQENEFLSNINNAKKVWSFALKVSLFSYRFPKYFKFYPDDENCPFEKASSAYLGELTGFHQVNPTDVFRALFSIFGTSKIHELIDEIDPILQRDLRLIRDANYVFIDAVDQSISQLKREAWICTQAGLLEAAYDLMRANQHIKIFASIRMEAYANYQSPVKGNVSGMLTELYYEKSELKQILDHLASVYESASSIEEFFEVDVVDKNGASLPEPAFEYVIRHTLGTPRELVHICRVISAAKKSNEYGEDEFRRLVNRNSSSNVPNVFEEKKPVLTNLTSNDECNRFYALLDRNIITKEELSACVLKFNGLDADAEIDISGLANPFLDLYSAGLLGYHDSSKDTETIEFHVSSRLLPSTTSGLPNSDYYFIHPSLQDKVQNIKSSYRIIPLIVVGHDYSWHPWNSILFELDSLMTSESDPDIKKVIKIITNILLEFLKSKELKSEDQLLNEIGEIHELNLQEDIKFNVERLAICVSELYRARAS